MNKKQKTALIRIVAAGVLAVALHFVPVTGLPQLALYLVPYLVAGYDVLRKAFLGIRGGQVFDENFLMAVATVGAMALGSYGEGVEVMVFYQIGELFQSYAVGKSRRSITQLMDIRPDSANIERDGEIESVDPDEVAVGDVIVVRPGERVPLDGEVIEGSSALNTSALTGESMPREIGVGDEIISGCVNESGLLRVRVTKCFDESTVSRILDLVENSSLKKARAENFITKFARYYTPAVCAGALLLAVVPPLFAGGWLEWIRRALTFLVISCPCALVISIPLSFFGGIGGASRAGILVKGGNYLEALADTRTVVFDKTGTLTHGVFAVSETLPADGVSEAKLLETAALAEIYSSHPISRSLREAVKTPLDANRVDEVREIAGHGLTARVDDRMVAVGNARLMDSLNIAFTPCERTGTVVYAAENGRFIGAVVISDQVKPTARRAIERLRAQGIETVMLTGDAEGVAQAVGAELGIDFIRAELLPADKVQNVEALLKSQRPREKLAFVGDGINDAPVLSRADIGIAMGGIGSDAAIEAADIVLMDDDPAKIPLAMRISRKCLRIVRENIAFALGVKAACLALGALGVTGMQAAIFADVGVMVLAVLNAARTLAPVKDAA
ncbi:MAG: cadmium-translocating P-type ATPase [Clostridia bacterium]|nr:cadmium-translocating P-type ATPase [Clostridia bacterium]